MADTPPEASTSQRCKMIQEIGCVEVTCSLGSAIVVAPLVVLVPEIHDDQCRKSVLKLWREITTLLRTLTRSVGEFA